MNERNVIFFPLRSELPVFYWRMVTIHMADISISSYSIINLSYRKWLAIQKSQVMGKGFTQAGRGFLLQTLTDFNNNLGTDLLPWEN